MTLDEREALAGLAETEHQLEAYAAERGLEVRSERPWPGALPPAEQPGPVKHAIWSIAGRLPGGATGRLRHQAVFGQTFGVEIAGHHTIMVCRLPESVGYLPMLCVRPDELTSSLYYWGGDRRERESARFESAELERRYIVEVAPGQGQNWLFQLFAPRLVDWIAHQTPRDFGFLLDNGVFTCETPQWRGQSLGLTEALDLLAESGGRVAGRIRDEVLEEELLGDAPDSAFAHADWAGKPKGGRVLGMLLKLVGVADDSVAAYGRERGMEPLAVAEFHSSHLRLPLPGTATDVLAGRLPGTEREGELAWIEYSSQVDMQRNYIALVLDSTAELPVAWIDPEDVGVAGFDAELPAPALEAASAAGYGISTAGRTACVYMRSTQLGAWPSGAEIDEFCPRAVAVVERLGG